MKSIKIVTIEAPNGEPMRDTSPDVLSREHWEFLHAQESKPPSERQPLPEDAGQIMNSPYLIRRMLDISTYKTRGDQKKADRVFEHMNVHGDVILLEDEDYSFVMKMLQDFPPYLQGRRYDVFHDAMENAEDVSVAAVKQEEGNGFLPDTPSENE